MTGRPPTKREAKLAYVRAKSELKAFREDMKKEPFGAWAKERINKMLEKVDPMEAVAVLGTTIMVHGIILRSTEVLEIIVNPAAAGGLGIVGTYGPTNMTEEQLDKLAENWGVPSFHLPPPSMKEDTWEIWLISFALSLVIIRHAGALIGLLDKGLDTVVKMFFGVGAAAGA